jgi:TP901 family phage tail tape measure protein
MAKKFDLSVLFSVVDRATRPVQKIGRSIGGLTKPVQRANDAIVKLGKSLKKTGASMKSIGQNMSLKLTAPIALISGLATKASLDFESAFTGVRKTVNATEKEFAVLKKELMDMALVIPISTTELFNIGEAAGQLGIKTKDIASFTKVIADLGATTNLTTEEAASSLAKFANITGLQAKDYERLGSTIVDLGNNMATTERDIVAMAMRLAGAGNTVGLTADQIMALSAALSSVGVEAEAGGTAFSQTMKKIDKEIGTGSKKMKGFAIVSGMTVKQFEKAWKEDAGSALISFTEGLAKMQKDGKNVNLILDALGFEGIRVSDSLLRAAGAGDQFREALKIGSKAWQENIALAKEANLRYSTSASRLTIAKNRVVQLAAAFGDVLVPMLLKVVDFFKPLVMWLQNLDPVTKTIIVVIGLLVAAIGPLIIGLGILTASIGAITAASTPLLIVMASISAAIIGIVGLAALIIKNWAPIAAFFGNLWGGIVNTFKDAINDIKKAYNSLIRILPESIEKRLLLKTDTEADERRQDAINKGASNPAQSLINQFSAAQKSQTDINLKVTTDQGTTATVQGVKNKGATNFNLTTAGYRGLGY